jgi:RNA polymerase primary sigma factor
VKIARAFDGLGVPLLDLISEGNIGLMKAVDRFKSERGSSLAAYASFWIKQRIRLALANHSRTIRVPAHVHEKLLQVRRTAAQLHNILGREPNGEEVAQAMRISSARLRNWQDAARSTVSLDQPLHGNDDLIVGGLIEDANARTPHETIVDAQTLEILSQCVAKLDPRAQHVLKWRFGLNGRNKRTLNQVGAQLGVTRERIRQIQNKALAILRKEIADRELIQLCA